MNTPSREPGATCQPVGGREDSSLGSLGRLLPVLVVGAVSHDEEPFLARFNGVVSSRRHGGLLSSAIHSRDGVGVPGGAMQHRLGSTTERCESG